ncbi:hypothetical protein BDN67DRAFT_457321 [Paxillus ammoniavirescens]|nr:hypothetical protein BDN67DRAFT_457321 [Paxillus ammoniavirescens]
MSTGHYNRLYGSSRPSGSTENFLQSVSFAIFPIMDSMRNEHGSRVPLADFRVARRCLPVPLECRFGRQMDIKGLIRALIILVELGSPPVGWRPRTSPEAWTLPTIGLVAIPASRRGLRPCHHFAATVSRREQVKKCPTPNTWHIRASRVESTVDCTR